MFSLGTAVRVSFSTIAYNDISASPSHRGCPPISIGTAFYDAASGRTVVRGGVRLRAGASGDFFLIDLHSGASPRGDL